MTTLAFNELIQTSGSILNHENKVADFLKNGNVKSSKEKIREKKANMEKIISKNRETLNTFWKGHPLGYDYRTQKRFRIDSEQGYLFPSSHFEILENLLMLLGFNVFPQFRLKGSKIQLFESLLLPTRDENTSDTFFRCLCKLGKQNFCHTLFEFATSCLLEIFKTFSQDV